MKTRNINLITISGLSVAVTWTKGQAEMRYIWFLGATAACSGVFCLSYLAWRQTPESDQMDYILALSPNAATIHNQLASAPTLTKTKRQELFAELFTTRFRKHDSKMAVRARFVAAQNGRSHIKLMCPARLEPWNMDRLALATWREAKDCLGETCDIDVYETFVYAPSRKIGELRNSLDKTPVAQIRHVYDRENQPSPAGRLTVPALRIHTSSVPPGVSFRLNQARRPSFSPTSVLAPPVH